MLCASLLFMVQCGITFFIVITVFVIMRNLITISLFDKSIIKESTRLFIVEFGRKHFYFIKCSKVLLFFLICFFNSGIVTGRSVANIVSMTANSFVNNFRTAANPQIVKRFSANDFDGSKHLLLISTKYSYFLMLILAFPVFLVAKQLLYLWLGQIPDYSVVFLQFAIVTTLLECLTNRFTVRLQQRSDKGNYYMFHLCRLFILSCHLCFVQVGLFSSFIVLGHVIFISDTRYFYKAFPTGENYGIYVDRYFCFI